MVWGTETPRSAGVTEWTSLMSLGVRLTVPDSWYGRSFGQLSAKLDERFGGERESG
jgi:hypothetical protein